MIFARLRKFNLLLSDTLYKFKYSDNLTSIYNTIHLANQRVHEFKYIEKNLPLKASSSCGPSYNISVLYFWAVTGDGKWMAIIANKVSPAGNHDFMTAFKSGLPKIEENFDWLIGEYFFRDHL